MGFFGSLLERRGVEGNSGLDKPASWLLDLLGVSGVGGPMTVARAESIATAWLCMKAISEDLAKIPLPVFQKVGESRRVVSDHPVSTLLNRANSPGLMAMNFREAVIRDGLNWGNGVAEIRTDAAGSIRRLHKVEWSSVSIEIGSDDSPVYRVRRRDGSEGRLTHDRAIHLRGPSDDGVVGLSVLGRARQTLATALGGEILAASLMESGARPSGILTYPGNRRNEATEKNLRESWQAMHAGADKAGKAAVLPDAIKWTPLSINPNDAQFLESRQFSALQVCRFYRVPPHKVFDLQRATWGNVEQMNLDYVTDCLLGWATRIEQEFNEKLFTQAERAAGLYVRHNFAALLRGDMKSRAESYSIALQNGWMNRGEVRALEEYDPMDAAAGRVFTVQSNLTTIPILERGGPAAMNKSGQGVMPADPQAPEAKRDLMKAIEPVLADAYRSLARIETDKVTRASSRGLSDWAEAFISTHTKAVEARLAPIVGCVLACLRGVDGRSIEERDGVAARFAAQRMAAVRQQLHSTAPDRAIMTDQWATLYADAAAANDLRVLETLCSGGNP